MAVAYIGLGSNLDEPYQQVQKAINMIKHFSDVTWLRSSALYLSKPWGVTDQPDFINAVVSVETCFTLSPFFDLLMGIEQKLGRVRNQRYGPRIIDCDLLLFDNVEYQDHRLVIPHPHILEREFVLHPLNEIASDVIIQKKTVAQWCLERPATTLKKIVKYQDVSVC